MDLFGLSMNFAPVSTLQFMVTMGAAGIIIIIFALYLAVYIGYMGRPMFKYLTARFNAGTGIIQEYIHENVYLRMASIKGGEFTSLEEGTRTKTKKRSYEFWKPEYTYTAARPIIAQSITSINGIDTLMVWNVTPPLPERYIKMLEALTTMGFNTMESLGQALQGGEGPKISPESELLTGQDKTTITDFLALHVKIRDRNKIIVTPDDILGFSEKYLDEHAKKSVIEKEVTIATKRLNDNKYQTYAFYLIALMIILGFALKAYKMKYGGG